MAEWVISSALATCIMSATPPQKDDIDNRPALLHERQNQWQRLSDDAGPRQISPLHEVEKHLRYNRIITPIIK